MAAGTGVDSTMATLASTLNSFVQKDIEPTVYDQVYKHNPILYRFWRKGKVKDGGAALTWPALATAKTKGGSYSGADQLAHGTEDTSTPAEVVWRHYYEDVTIPRTDLLKARTPYAKVDLVKFKFDEAITALRSRVSGDIYQNVTGPKGLDFLFQAVDDSTDYTTYASIAHSNTYWKAGINGDGRVDFAATPVVALTDIEDPYSRATDGDEQPSLIIATPKGFNFVWGQMQALQRFTRDEEMTKAGFEALKFNRAVMVVDRNMADPKQTASPGGPMLFLNERWIDLVSHEEEDWAVDPILPGTPSERSLNTKIVWSGNLRVKILKYHAKLVNVSNF